MLRAGQSGDAATLENGMLTVRFDRKAGTLTARCGQRAFVTEGRLSDAADAVASTRLVDLKDALGTGKGVEAAFASGRVATLALYEGLPFACVRASVSNPRDEPVTVAELTPLAATVDAGAPAGELCAFGADGPAPLTADRPSYAFLALASPKTRAGIVCGWLTHCRGSGIVVGKGGGSVRLEGISQYGRLLVPAKGSAEGEILAIGWFDDALLGLDAYADAVAQAHAIRLPAKVPSGYCTWYHAGASDEGQIAQLAEFAGERLRDYGFDFVQIDDGWQLSGRDFTTHDPRGRFPGGMRETAESITSQGLVAGIWLIPFGWDPEAPALAGHPDWFAQKKEGGIYSVHWAGSCLDPTHPAARAFLAGVVGRMAKEWGYKYLKIDGLWSGMAVKILYPSPKYRPDDLGDAVLHDPTKTQVEAYREGLKLVRQAAGQDVFLLGCNIAQNMRTLGASVGLVDGMRIGPDIGASWDAVRRCAASASHLYFLNGRVWFNDPDCLMLREPLTLDQARAWGSLIALSGQMNVVSEWLPGLPAERLDVVKRTMPNVGACGRPIDLFESPLPRVWHLPVGEGEGRADLVGLFNWDEHGAAEIALDLARLGLPAGRCVGYDYWEQAFVPPFEGARAFRLRPGSCRVLALRRLLGRPQLVSTSRHVSQGAVDIVRIEWDGAGSVLRGTSRLVADDPCELRIAAPPEPASWRATKATASDGVAAELSQDGPWVRVVLTSPATREASWEVAFEKGPARLDGWTGGRTAE